MFGRVWTYASVFPRVCSFGCASVRLMSLSICTCVSDICLLQSLNDMERMPACLSACLCVARGAKRSPFCVFHDFRFILFLSNE